jgi:hypothetical protein
MGGTPYIGNMHVTVGMTAGMVASGFTQSEIQDLYPTWKRKTLRRLSATQLGVLKRHSLSRLKRETMRTSKRDIS